MKILALVFALLAIINFCEGKYEKLSNAVGTPCNQDLASAKMDVLLFVDISPESDVINQVQLPLQRLFSAMTLDDVSGSCIRLYLHFWSFVQLYNGTNIQGFSDEPFPECLDYYTLTKQLQNVTTRTKTGRSSTIFRIFDVASSVFTRLQSITNRKPVLIFTSHTITYLGYSNSAPPIAQKLKDSGVQIISISSNIDKYYVNGIVGRLSSPGKALHLYEDYFEDNLYSALTYVNCECPKYTRQLYAFNPQNKHVDYYGDCLQSVADAKVSYFAEKDCETRGGSLVALTSPEKFSFVHEEVVSADFDLQTTREYNVGLHRTKEDALQWYYYDKENLPLGSYQKWASDYKPGAGYCGFVSIGSDSQYGMNTAGCNKKVPYVCQLKA